MRGEVILTLIVFSGLMGYFFKSCNKDDLFLKTNNSNKSATKQQIEQIKDWYENTKNKVANLNKNISPLNTEIEPDIEINEIDWDKAIKIFDSANITGFEITIHFNKNNGEMIKLNTKNNELGVKGLIFKYIPDENWFKKWEVLEDSIPNITAIIKIYLPNKKHYKTTYIKNGQIVLKEVYFDNNRNKSLSYKLNKKTVNTQYTCVVDIISIHSYSNNCNLCAGSEFGDGCDECNLCGTTQNFIVTDCNGSSNDYSFGNTNSLGNINSGYFNQQQYLSWLSGGDAISDNAANAILVKQIAEETYRQNYLDFDYEIKNEFTKPCLTKILDDIKNISKPDSKTAKLNLDAKTHTMAEIINQFNQPENTFPNWDFTITNGNLNTSKGRTRIKFKDNDISKIDIIIDNNYSKNASDIAIARTIFHETIHAYLTFYYQNFYKYEPSNLNFDFLWNSYINIGSILQIDHTEMLNKYIEVMQKALIDYAQYKGYDVSNKQYYKDLCYSGLIGQVDLSAYLTTGDINRIKDNIQKEDNFNNSIGTKPCN